MQNGQALNLFAGVVSPVTGGIGQALNDIIGIIRPTSVAQPKPTDASTVQPIINGNTSFSSSNQCPVCPNFNFKFDASSFWDLTVFIASTNNTFIQDNTSNILYSFINNLQQEITKGQASLNTAQNNDNSTVINAIQSVIDATLLLIQSIPLNLTTNVLQLLNNIKISPNVLDSTPNESLPTNILPISSLAAQFQNVLNELPAIEANIVKTEVNINSKFSNISANLNNLGNNIVASVPSIGQGIINVLNNTIDPIVTSITINANKPIVQFFTNILNDITNLNNKFQIILDNATTNAAPSIAKIVNIELVLLFTLTAPSSANCSVNIRKDISNFSATQI